MTGAALRSIKAAGRWLLGSLVVVWLVFAAVVLVLRYQVLPDIARYKDTIEQQASQALGLAVRIGGVRAGWEGLRPELLLNDVQVLDRQGGSALSFRRVEAVLSWRSLAFRELRLHRLFAEGPTVLAERLASGEIYVAGFQVYPSAGRDSALADWVLHQDRIVVEDARIVWRDATRRPTEEGAPAPILTLDAVSLRLENWLDGHRFALRAAPPAALAGRLDLRGELKGESLNRPEQWQGDIYLSMPQLDLAAWRQWFDPPIKLDQGRGGMRLWGKVAAGRLDEVSADLALADVKLTLAEHRADGGEQSLPELDLSRFQGRLGVRREGADGYRVSGLDLSLLLRDGLRVSPTSFFVQWTPFAPAQGGGSAGLVVVSELDVGQFVRLSSYLPLDRQSRETLQRYAPGGALKNLNLTWRGDAERLQSYSLQTGFTDLGMRPNGLLPGFEGLSGKLVADEAKGQVELASGPLVLHFPAVFPQPRIALDELNAKVGWTLSADALEVNFPEVAFSGPDAAGRGRGSYRLALSERAPREWQAPGELDLTASLSQADATAVWRYLPHLIAPEVRHWVRYAVKSGQAREVELILHGPLAEFPFPKNANGRFLVKARVSDGRLAYAPGWPEITELDTDLRFEGAGASFDARQGSLAGVRVGKVKAAIADFAATPARLTVAGEAQGALPGFIQFLDRSPLGEMLGQFHHTIRLSGEGKLALALDLPLDDPEQTLVKGDFDISGGTALIDPLLPPVTAFAGRVSFTENSARASGLSGQFFGRPALVDLRAEGNEVRVAASGSATASELQRQYPSPLLKALAGTLPWQAAVSVRHGEVGFAVESSLEGMQSTLPEPFRKRAETPLAVRFSRNPVYERNGKPAREAPAVTRDQLRLEIGELAGATLIRRLDGNRAVIERGVAAVGDGWPVVPVPASGLRVVVNQSSLDLDQWRAAVTPPKAAPGAATSNASTETSTAPGDEIDWPTPQFDLKAHTIKLFGRQWRDLSITAMPSKGGIGGRIEARDMAGDWSWENAGKGTLRARLQQLNLPDATTDPTQTTVAEASAAESPDDLPALDIVAEQLLLGKRSLGRLEVQAENTGGRWRVPRFQLASPDGNISGKGVWTPPGAGVKPNTQVDLAVETRDIGKLLVRFGYPDAVRRGHGKLTGQLNWQGAPTALHAPSLNGKLELNAERGQFNKLEPGIGKLLSLLSLQMLPRRISLDFRDVFSDGFAFEKINGKVQVTNGVFATRDLVVEGPAAKVLMQGTTNLATERLMMQVTVQPELGSTVALGAAMAVNPAVGVATLLAQKLFRDPFNKVFAFEYEITGTLSDPQINKIGGPPVSAASGSAPPVPRPPAN